MPSGRFRKRFKMIKPVSIFAARNFLVTLISAAFLSIAGPTHSMTLDSLDLHLERLVRSASRFVVTVESIASRNGTQGTLSATTSLNFISSGIIVDTSGLVLTAAASVYGFPVHYVWYDQKPYKAELLGIDYRTGVALLRADLPRVAAAILYDEEPGLGRMVLALGNAYGMSVAPSLGFCVGVREDGNLQFTAPISSGSIGGGLFTMTGKLAGLIISGFGSGLDTQTGIAVPAYQLGSIIAQMECCGSRKAGYLGISSADVEYYESHSAGMVKSGENLVNGAFVTDVVRDSPAEKAGLRPGDIITGINTLPVFSAGELMQYIMQSLPGSEVNLQIIRNARTLSVQATLGAAPINAATPGQTGFVAQTQYIRADSLQSLIYGLEKELESLQKQIRQIR